MSSLFAILVKSISFFGGTIGLILGALKLKEHLTTGARKNRRHQYLFTAAENFFKQNNIDSAIVALNEVIKESPENIRAQRRKIDFMLASVENHAYDGNIDPARFLFDERYASAADSKEISEALNSIYYLQTIQPKYKHDATLMLIEAKICKLKISSHQHALEILHKANKLHPRRQDILAEYGLMLANSDKEAALDCLEQASQISPSSPLPWFYSASIRYASYDIKQATAQWERCLKEYFTAYKLFDPHVYLDRCARKGCRRAQRNIYQAGMITRQAPQDWGKDFKLLSLAEHVEILCETDKHEGSWIGALIPIVVCQLYLNAGSEDKMHAYIGTLKESNDYDKVKQWLSDQAQHHTLSAQTTTLLET